MKKTPLLLLGLILIPVIILGWLSARLEQNQQALLKHQFEGLIEIQLSDIDQLFQAHLRSLEKALNAEALTLYKTKDPTYPLSKLKQLSKRSPYIEQVFVLNTEGQTLFPEQQTRNRVEREFLQDTAVLRRTPSIFQLPSESFTEESKVRATPPNTIQGPAPFSARLKSAPVQEELAITTAPQSSQQLSVNAELADELSISSEPAFASSGWLAWYHNFQLQHIYWRKDHQGEILGFAINSARLVSDLINLLPTDNSPEASALNNAKISLIDSRGEINYEWGGLDSDSDLTKPIKTLPLSHPLGSWKLEYQSPGLKQPASHWFEKVTLVLLTFFCLSVIAWLIHRENTRATRLAEQRVNFVNQVSHELKTPLTNVRMYAELLDGQFEEDNRKAKRYLSVINNESQRLSRLIDNVLSFSRLGRNKVELTLTPGTLSECLQNALAAFAPSFSQHGLHIQLNDQCPNKVLLDKECTEQVLNNLLSNCEKYATQSGEIQVECWQENKTSFIRVKDQGPGISPEQANRIFTPFYRISNKLTDGVSGTGIGLSIAREMARKHGGDLKLETSSTGASFLFSLHTPPTDPSENNK